MKKETAQKKANSIARKAGYSIATEIQYDENETEGKVKRHEPWGFQTNSGKFFPYVRTTRYGWNGHYSSQVTIVVLPKKYLES